LLYTRKFDGFCLITSDSDFTGLAMRLREEGLTVLGFGEKKTPEAFRNACHKFVFTEVLRPNTVAEPISQLPKGESEQNVNGKAIGNHSWQFKRDPLGSKNIFISPQSKPAAGRAKRAQGRRHLRYAGGPALALL
jgi:hypothetical protein